MSPDHDTAEVASREQKHVSGHLHVEDTLNIHSSILSILSSYLDISAVP